MNQLYVYIHPLFFEFPSLFLLGHQRALVDFPVLYSRFSLVIYFIHSDVYMGFPGGSVVLNLPAYAGDTGDTGSSWVRKIPWSRKWQPTPVFLPGKFQGRGAWQVTVHGVIKSQT